MIRSMATSSANARRKLWIQLLAFVALAAVFYLKPRVEAWLEGQAQSGDSSVVAKAEATQESDSTSREQKSSENPSSPITKMERADEKPRREISDPEKSNPPPKTVANSSDPELGKLKEVEDNVFESTAGLFYGPGGAEGHRLKHVMEHAKDNPQKEIHGVFDGDGDRDIILAVIDEAFAKAKKGGSDVRSEKQNGNRVYTVNLRRRIGQMGGAQGERQGNPDCRYLRLVLRNENEVITAYPTKSF